MQHMRRPTSQPKIKQSPSRLDKMNQLRSSKNPERFKSQHQPAEEPANGQIMQLLAELNMQQYYKQVSAVCQNNFETLLKLKSFSAAQIPLGYQLKLSKAIGEIQDSRVDSRQKQAVLENKQVEAPQQAKKCCWICYQLIYESVEFYGKEVCSQACKEVLLREMTIKCKRCGKSTIKFDAVNSFGEWYCGRNCVFSEEELLMQILAAQRKGN